MTALLSVKDLTVTFATGRGPLRAVAGIDFDLARGEVLAIVGESGSGKSVTSLALMSLLPNAQVSGQALLDGTDLLKLEEHELRKVRGKRIAMVFQDPMSSMNPVRTIGVQLEETVRLHLGLSREAARKRAAELLDMVGIPSPAAQLKSYPHQLSGGMRQRVMIAMALSSEPEVVIADEPTTALDVSVQAQILELLRSVTGAHGTSLIMISHDLSVVAGLADRVAVMYAGRLVDVGETQMVFERPQHPYTIGLLQCIPSLAERPMRRLRSIEGSPPDLTVPTPGCTFAPRCPFVMDRCRIDVPPLELKETGQLAACWADLTVPDRAPVHAASSPAANGTREFRAAAGAAAAFAGDPVISVEGLKVHFPIGRGLLLGRRRGTVRAVDGVSFDIKRGETLSLVGESGSGKSTTARAVLQVERVTAGTVKFEGRSMSSLSSKQLLEIRPRLQMVFQDPYGSLNPRRSVGATVAEPLIVHNALHRDRVPERVAELLDTVGLSHKTAESYPYELSGGQRQRVSIARALALRPTLIVADEPTSALDVSVRAQILNLMQDLQAEASLTYLFISHDLSVVRHVSNRVAVMYLGKIVEIGNRDEVYGNPQHPYTQALLSVVPIPNPRLERKRRRAAIAGEIPSPANPPSGCRFHPRCPLAFDRCKVEEPALLELGGSHAAACFLAKPHVTGSAEQSFEAHAGQPLQS